MWHSGVFLSGLCDCLYVFVVIVGLLVEKKIIECVYITTTCAENGAITLLMCLK